MATHWNASKTPLDTAVSALIVFSTSFVINGLYDSWPKLKQKYTRVKRLKRSLGDAQEKKAQFTNHGVYKLSIKINQFFI